LAEKTKVKPKNNHSLKAASLNTAFARASLLALSLLVLQVSAQAETPSGAPVKDEMNLLYMKARQRVMDGKFEEAAPLLESAIKTDPENPLLNYQLAEVYLRLNQFEKAEGLAKRAVDLDPKNLEYRSTLGGIYASVKKYPEAKEQYKKIVELDPSNGKAPLLLGILEAESGDTSTGIATLSKILSENQDNYMALFYRAKIFLEVDQTDKAKADLDRCLTVKPNFVEAGTALGLLYERQNSVDEAIKVYSRIQGNGPFKKRLAILYLQKNEMDKALQELLEYEQVEKDDYTARVKVGLIYFELKQYEKAKEKFLSILKDEPKADNVRFYLGWVYEELKQYDKARAEFLKVKADSNLYKEAMLHVGFMFKDGGKHKEGVAFAKGLIKSNPEIMEFYDMQASFYEAQKEFKLAMKAIEEGLKKNPEDEKLLYFQGALYDKMNERAKSVANMRKIIAQNPNNAHALNFLGYTFAEKGENLDEAEQLITRALTLRPNDGYIEDSMAWVLFKKGKIDEALARLEKAITLQPEEAVIYEHLGDVYTAKKDFAKAMDFYKKGLAFSAKKDKEMAKKLEGKLAALPKEKRVPSGDEQKD
jgi:tetratricopeptide (TPR) repeat protein